MPKHEKKQQNTLTPGASEGPWEYLVVPLLILWHHSIQVSVEISELEEKNVMESKFQSHVEMRGQV